MSCPKCGTLSVEEQEDYIMYGCQTTTVKGEIIQRGLECRLIVAERRIEEQAQQIQTVLEKIR